MDLVDSVDSVDLMDGVERILGGWVFSLKLEDGPEWNLLCMVPIWASVRFRGVQLAIMWLLALL